MQKASIQNHQVRAAIKKIVLLIIVLSSCQLARTQNLYIDMGDTANYSINKTLMRAKDTGGYCLLINILTKKNVQIIKSSFRPLTVIKCFINSRDYKKNNYDAKTVNLTLLNKYWENTVLPELKRSSSEGILDTVIIKEDNREYILAEINTVEFYDIAPHTQKELESSPSMLNPLAPIAKKINNYSDSVFHFAYKFNNKWFKDWRNYLISKGKGLYTFIKFQNEATDNPLLINKKFTIDFTVGVVSFYSPYYIDLSEAGFTSKMIDHDRNYQEFLPVK